MDKILCKTCLFWVDCSKEDKTDGFCLMEDLFTHTAKTKCPNYEEGKPMNEQEYEDYNASIY